MKKNPKLSYPGLRYAHKKLNLESKQIFFGKCLFAYKIRFALEKKTKKVWGKFSKLLGKIFDFCVVYRNCMVSIFFSKKKKINQFFLSPVCSTVLKKPQKWFNFCSIGFRKCMKTVSQAFSPYTWCMELYDNDFCCMELYDKLFRCMEVNPGNLYCCHEATFGTSLYPIYLCISYITMSYYLFIIVQ